MFDIAELVKRIIKYLVMGFMVGLVAFLIPKKGKTLDLEEVCLIGLSAACVFSILEMYLPSVSVAAKNGLGFSIGAGLLGGVPIMV